LGLLAYLIILAVSGLFVGALAVILYFIRRSHGGGLARPTGPPQS
jgi:hypothetical protein